MPAGLKSQQTQAMNPFRMARRGVPSSPAWLGAALALVLAADAGAASHTYTHFRFTPTLLRDGGSALCQLSEFVFKNGGAVVDNSGVIVTNPDGESPGNEGPANLIDENTATKWLGGFNAAPIGGLVFEFPSAVTIDAYSFATANDADGRDPVSWTLEGSENGADWTLIDTVDTFSTTPARFTQQIDFLKPVILSFTTDSGILINGDFAVVDWDALYLDSATITPGPGAVTPTDFGSANLTPPDDSETVYTFTGSAADADDVTASVTVRTVDQATKNYQFFRFSPLKLRGNGTENSIQIAEFEFSLGGSPVVPTSVTVEGGGNSPAAEGIDKLTDGDTGTKWLNFDKFNAVVFDFGAPTDLDAYQYVTANDAPQRDPVRWYIEGSNDGASWELVDNVNTFDFPVTTDRLAPAQTLEIPFPVATPPVIVYFTGDAANLVAGEPLVLSANVVGATTVEIDNGVGAIDPMGSTSPLFPGADTSYTLSATNGSFVVTETFDVTIVNPTLTTIAYDDFGMAGDELELIGDAGIVNDSANIPLPGDVDRLRLTPDEGSKKGTAWFRKRIDTSAGFDMTCGIQMASPSGSGGADGMSFMVQNTVEGTQAHPQASEDGLAENSLSVCFDAYDNDGAETAEPNSGFIEVRMGSTILATATLSEFGITLRGTDPTDLTDDTAQGAPYAVRVAYTAGSPGTLDVFFEGVQVVSALEVDLAAGGAVDGDGKAYVGFSGRAGGVWQAHDVTSWHFTEGAPVLPVGDFRILDFDFDFGTGMLSVTFRSSEERSYRITSSSDLGSFTTELGTGIPGAAGMTQTTAEVPFTPATADFIRVEEE